MPGRACGIGRSRQLHRPRRRSSRRGPVPRHRRDCLGLRLGRTDDSHPALGSPPPLRRDDCRTHTDKPQALTEDTVSGFWDAVGRAALGQPGTAIPRSHSLFEPDGRNQPTEDFEASDTDVEEESPRPAPMESIQPVSPAAHAGSPERPRSELVMTAAAEEKPDRQPAEIQAAEPRRAELPANSAPNIERALEPDSVPASPLRTLERIEIHRFETTRVVAEPIQLAPEERAVPAVVAAAAPPRAPATPARNDFLDSVDESVANQPAVAVVAEPRAIVAEWPSIANEPPLIVEIDRIDIRIESQVPAALPVSRRRDAGPAPSLDQYLEKRSGAQR